MEESEVWNIVRKRTKFHYPQKQFSLRFRDKIYFGLSYTEIFNQLKKGIKNNTKSSE